MRFVEHQVYLVRNARTGAQGQYFEAYEVLEYRGHYIIYGELRPDQIEVFRGVRLTPGKVVAFPVLRNTVPGEVAKLVNAMGGDVLTISEPTGLVTGALKAVVGEELLLINCNQGLAKVWAGGEPNVRDALMRKCTRQIDLYLDWKGLGKAPTWFISDRNKARAPVNRN